MYYVYILKSLTNSEKIYIGFTLNLKVRLDTHNDGESIYTAKYKPWALVSYTAFKDKSLATSFENQK